MSVIGSENPGAANAAPGPPIAFGPLIAGGVLLIAGGVLFAQAASAAAENGVTLGGPTLAPLIVTGLWVVSAIGYLTSQLRAPRSRPRSAAADSALAAGSAASDSGIVPAESVRWRTPFLLLAALVGYALVLKYTVAGYVLATAAFVLLAARLLSTRPLREVILRDVATAAGLSLGIYLVFTRLLGIVLPAGVLPL